MYNALESLYLQSHAVLIGVKADLNTLPHGCIRCCLEQDSVHLPASAKCCPTV